MTTTEWRQRLDAVANAPRDAASLAAFRVLFGLVLFASVVRALAEGWVRDFFIERSFFFKYWGFEWVSPLPDWGMYAAFAALGLAAIGIAAGAWYRLSVATFFVGFTYVELIDVTNYLNHYYLVSLLCALCFFLPLNAAWSIDAWREPTLRRSTLPAWNTYLLRFQVGLVYVFAGLAKLSEDWLVHAQPLRIWLSSRSDLPVLGSVLSEPWAPHALAWGGFLFDTSIVVWLLSRRTRPLAYLALVTFHLVTGALFTIGMFPFIMTTVVLVFFSPSWPRRLLPQRLTRWLDCDPTPQLPSTAAALPSTAPAAIGLVGHRTAWLVAAYCLIQVLVPLRHHLYPGDVRWNEEGMRWSWHVMVRAKTGSVTYRVTLPGGPQAPSRARTVLVNPRRYLTQYQAEEMSGQPDLILQLAHHIARDFAERGHGHVQIRADTLVSLNGRAPAPLIDPNIDLVTVEDGPWRARWITAAPPPLGPERAITAQLALP